MENKVIEIHALTKDPTSAWQEISKDQNVVVLTPEQPNHPVETNKVRFVCMSDTHLAEINFDIPPGDVFIHAGDFTQICQKHEIIQFNTWLKSLPHKYKIVIAGNHELTFDDNVKTLFGSGLFKDGTSSKDSKKLLTNCIYLEDSGVELFGIKIYGSPWQPKFGGWAFNLPRGPQCLSKWDLIPDDTDILITHGPPVGFGDLVSSGERAGCVELLATIQKRVKPNYHICGHIHEAYGMSSDGTTTFINASTCNKQYKAVNLPIVFDVPLPQEQSKETFRLPNERSTSNLWNWMPSILREPFGI